VQAAGAWKESEMAQDPGGPLRPFPAERQQWRRARDRREAHGRCVHGVRPRGSDTRRRPQLAAGHKSPQRGCWKATAGR